MPIVPNDLKLESRVVDGMRLVGVGIVVNVVLAVVKFAGGWLGNSKALLADGLESLLDIMSSVMMWWALKVAGRPPDEGHPYGHGKVESLAAVLGALILVGAGLGLGWHSLSEFWKKLSGADGGPESFTLVVALVTVLAKEGLYRVMIVMGREIGSAALMADAWHHRSDALTSLVTLLGLGVAVFGSGVWVVADSLAALICCGLIVVCGLGILRRSVGEMLDEQMQPSVISAVVKAAGGVPGVTSVEKCRVRKSGLTRLADLHIRVSGRISVREGHEIAHEAKDRIMNCGQNISDVTVHVEPEKDS